MLTLSAKDEAGNEGTSTPTEVQLPQRVFAKVMARALIEQRRNLALDAEAKPKVLTALDALTIEPEKFRVEASITARPFFESRGFVALARQVVSLRGIDFVNDRMERRLG